MFEAQKKARDLSDDFKRKIIAEIANTGATGRCCMTANSDQN